MIVEALLEIFHDLFVIVPEVDYSHSGRPYLGNNELDKFPEGKKYRILTLSDVDVVTREPVGCRQRRLHIDSMLKRHIGSASSS